MERGAGFAFVDAVKGGVIPNTFIPAVEKGVRQAMAAGSVAGFPMQDIKVTVYDGKNHPVDGKEIAFVTAGKKGLPGGRCQGPAHRAGTHRQRRADCTPDSAIGRRQRRPLRAPRPDHRPRQTGRGGMITVVGQVAPLAELDSPAIAHQVADRRPGFVHAGIQPLRTGAAACAAENGCRASSGAG
jgi:elongation factor G